MILRKYFLLVVSLLFYTCLVRWQIFLLLLLAGAIVLTDRITKNPFQCMASVLTILLLISGFLAFKGFTSAKMIVGYSVFAFSGISHIIDQYKGRKYYSIIDTLVYLFFFPKMMAGPIVRASEFIPQLCSKHKKWMEASIYQGFKLSLYGCFLKFIIADNLLCIERDAIGVNLALQSLIWGIRFYLDFYAYSLIAVGVAMWFGITLPYNFDNPYSSESFRDFWKRWNITLSTWLRDYIYIPLGGSKRSQPSTFMNILLTFVISGLWHGISIPFVLWGLAHSAFVSMERFVIRPTKRQSRAFKLVYRVFVVIVTAVLWQLFRFDDCTDIMIYGQNLCGGWNINPSILLTLGVAVVFLFVVESKQIKSLVFHLDSSRLSIYGEATLFSLMLAILLLCPYKYTFSFFYFSF